jgi:hypothetical protein
MLELATLLLAIATVALAAAAVWNTLEQGWRQERSAVRAALLEQYANTRRWSHGRPGVRTRLAEKLASDPTPVAAVRQFIVRVDLPADLTAYIVWLLERVEREQREYAAAYPDSQSTSRSHDLWIVQVDHLQTIVQIIRCHAESRSALRNAARSFAAAAWLVPYAGPPDWRENARIQQEAQEGRPPFPVGRAFTQAHPRARDVASYGSETALQLTRDAPGSGLGEWHQAEVQADATRPLSWRERLLGRR